MMMIMMAPHRPIAALLLLLVGATAAAAAAPPIVRSIRPELTASLLQQLKAANISLLLVLPGAQPQAAMKLDWARVGAEVEQLTTVTSYESFAAHWHGLYKHHRWGSRPAGGAIVLEAGVASHAGRMHPPLTLIDSAAALPDDSPHPLHAPAPPRVALLVRGENGAVRSATSNLAAAITRRLRHSYQLSLVYSTHADKGDSLVTFAFDGEPLQANFLATSVFRDAFTNIYNKSIWGSGESGGGGSGAGSNLAYTATIRAALPDLLKRYNINSMIDSSCGSMHWMPMVLNQTSEGFRFMGTDVVCTLIDRHKRTFANHPNWQFQCVDYSNQPLPKGYDLVWSRDSLQHIPMHGAYMFLNNVRASGAKYLLVGSYIKSTAANGNIKAGEYYSIDLLKPPFKLSRPLEVIEEGTPDGKHMLLFRVADLTWEDNLDGLV